MSEDRVISNMGVDDILKYHNCKHPMLMIDYVNEVFPGKYAKGYKNFTYNEWFFSAHFEDDPNVPSSIMLEALSQIMLMTILTIPGNEKKHTACLKINNVSFKRKIIPGERLDLRAEVKSQHGGVFIGFTEGLVYGEIAVKADYTIGIPNEIKSLTPRGK